MRWSVLIVATLVVLGGWIGERAWASEGEILFFAEEGDARGIYAMDFGGRHVRKVGTLKDREAVITRLSCSRDGGRLLCVVAMEERAEDRKVVMKGTLTREGMGRYVDDWEITGTATLRTAVLSPDGRRIAWVGETEDGGMALWVKEAGATLEGSRSIVRCERGAQIWSPSFDGAGARIAYVVNRGKGGRLEVVNLEGEGSPLHRMDGERIVSVDWSFGGEIAFMSARGRVFAMDPDGSEVRRTHYVREIGDLSKEEIGHPRVVRWSRDGTKWAVGCFPDGVAVMNEKGEVERWIEDERFSRYYGTMAVRPLPVRKDVASERHSRTMAYLLVDSVPSGARVYVDGTVRGNTPFRTKMEGGTHRIKVEKAFHADWEKTLYLSKGEKKRIVAQLGKYGHLRVSSEPSKASLFVGGVFAGSTPVMLESLPVGPQIIEVKCEGWEEMREVVPVESGRTTEVRVALRKPMVPLLTAKDIGRTVKTYVPIDPDAVMSAKKGLWKQKIPWGMFYGGLSAGAMGAKFVYEKADTKAISLCVGGLICALVAYPAEKEDERAKILQAIREQNEAIRQYNAETERLLKEQNALIETKNREIEVYNREMAGKQVEVH